MKKIFSIFCMVCMGVLFSMAQNGSDSMSKVKVKFLDSYEDALKEAAETQKPIFFNCFADWAVPCHSMNEVVFSDADFAQWLNENFVCLCLNTVDTKNQYLVEKYNIRFYAHFLILDPQGNLIHRIVGGEKLPEFKDQVARGLDSQRTLVGMNQRFEAGERDIDFLRDYIDVLQHANEGDKQKEMVNIYVSSIDSMDLVKKENWNIFGQVVEDIHSVYYDFLLRHFSDFAKENGVDDVKQLISFLNIRAIYPYLFDSKGYEELDIAGIEKVMNQYLSPDDLAFLYLTATKARGEGRISDFINLLKEIGPKFQPEILQYADLGLVSVIKDHPEWKGQIEAYLQERAKLADVPSVAQAYKDALLEIENDGKGVHFEEVSFAEVLAKAKAEKKLVFMDCYTSWCGPCKILAKRIFPLKEVGDFFNTHFVNIKMDMEKGEGIELAKRYEVLAFPTMLVLDSEGNLVHRIMGTRPPQQLIEQIKRAFSTETAYVPVKEKYDAGDRTPRVVMEYLLNMSAAGNMSEEEVGKIAREFWTSLSDEQKITEEILPFYENFVTDPENEMARYFLKHRKDYQNKIEDKARAEKALLRIYFPFLMEFLPTPDLGNEKLQTVLKDIEEAGSLKDKSTLGYLALVIENAAKQDWKSIFKIYQKKIAKMDYKFGQMNLDMLWKRFWPLIPTKMKGEVISYLEEEAAKTVKTSVNNYKTLLNGLKAM